METQPLTWRQLFGYGVGDFGINLYFISAMTYLLYFYTDVFGLTAAAAAGVFLVARVVDAVTDPLMGLLAERTQSRVGRMRPYLLYGAIPLAVITVLTFTAVDGSQSFKLWWAYTTYILFGILYTIVTIPYAALTASLTTDSRERTKLSTVRMACAFSGGFAVSVGTIPLVGMFETEAQGFFWLMVAFSVIATLLIWATFAGTEEAVQPPQSQRLRLRESLQAVFSNPPLGIVMVLFCGGMLSFTVRQAAAVYFFKYNVERPDMISTFFTATLLVMLVGLIGVPKLAARLNKAGAIVAGSAVSAVGCLGLYFTPWDATSWIVFWGCVTSLGATPVAVLGWAMIPDTVEYAQWRHGVRADGAIFSFSSFFQKLAKAAGGAGVAGALAIAGFVANVEQSEASLAAIHNMMTLVPLGIIAVTALAAAFYPLNRERHGQIVRELEAQQA